MDEIKTQIKYESSRATQLSREARTAYLNNDWKRGKALMKEVVTASKNCQTLIEQFNQSTQTIAQS